MFIENYLEHYFKIIHQYSNGDMDFKCIHCNILIWYRLDYNLYYYIDTWKFLTLTCDEMIIKNIID